MQCKPILFNTEMVRAILEGRKTVTRRLIKPRYRDDECGFQVFTNAHTGEFVRVEKVSDQGSGIFPDGSERYVKPPYWPGDILYVRETWRVKEAGYPPRYCEIEYKAGGTKRFERIIALPTLNGEWKPSIHLPKKAARLFLKVTDVRAERLHDMSVDDIQKEGIQLTAREEECNCAWATEDCRQQPCTNRDAYLPAMYVSKFAALWDSTIKDDRYLEDSYSKNPWVWVIEFERCEKPIKKE